MGHCFNVRCKFSKYLTKEGNCLYSNCLGKMRTQSMYFENESSSRVCTKSCTDAKISLYIGFIYKLWTFQFLNTVLANAPVSYPRKLLSSCFQRVWNSKIGQGCFNNLRKAEPEAEPYVPSIRINRTRNYQNSGVQDN